MQRDRNHYRMMEDWELIDAACEGLSGTNWHELCIVIAERFKAKINRCNCEEHD